jgi:TP901 family phage tail tape measure protein
MAGRFTVAAMFKALDGLTRPVSSMQRKLETFEKATKRLSAGLDSVAKVNQRVIGGLKTIGAAALAGGALAGAGVAKVVTAGADFEAALSNVQAVAKLSRGELEKLGNVASSTGPKFGIGPTKAVEAMETMIKAGYSAEDAMNGLGTALASIVVAKGDVGIVEQLMSSVKGLGLANDQLGRVSDVFSKAADATKADVATVADSMAKFGPVSRQFGFSLESAVGMIALLQDAGLDASEVGTSLASSFSKLAAPSTEAQKQIAKLGLVLKDAKGNLLPPMQLLKNLAKGLEKVQGTAAKADVIKDLVGLESQKALLNLTADMGKLHGIITSLEGAKGYTGELANTQLDNTRGSWEKFKATIEAVEARLFTLQSGPLKGVIDGYTQWLGANKELIATGVQNFIAEAIPIIREFGVGMKDGATQVLSFASGIQSLIGPFDSVFGASTSQRIANARELGEWLVKGTAAVLGFAVVTKTASAAVFLFGLVSKGTKAILWTFEAAVGGAKLALVAYRTWTELGAAGTYRLAAAALWVNGQLVAQKAAALGAAVGIRGVGAAALGARVGLTGMGAAAAGALGPIGLLITAVMLLKDAWEELERVAGGSKALWAGIKSAFTADQVDEMGNPISTGGFFAGIDAELNRQAKTKAAQDEQAEKLTGQGVAPQFDSAFAGADLAAEMAKFEEVLKRVNAQGLGSDAPVQRPPAPGAKVEPQVSSSAERGAARVERSVTEMRDKLEVTIKPAPGTEAEVTQKPKRATVNVKPSGAD